ncbi:ABC transporter permease, partial [Micromonospora sp. NPDC006766]
MSEMTPTVAPKRADDAPAEPSAVQAGAAKPAAPAGLSFWRGDGGEGARRNLGLLATLLVLVVIGIVTRPDLYGDAGWVWGNTLTILKLASVVGVVTV